MTNKLEKLIEAHICFKHEYPKEIHLNETNTKKLKSEILEEYKESKINIENIDTTHFRACKIITETHFDDSKIIII